jgi:hypothetical protein
VKNINQQGIGTKRPLPCLLDAKIFLYCREPLVRGFAGGRAQNKRSGVRGFDEIEHHVQLAGKAIERAGDALAIEPVVLSSCRESRVPHISLVFREMWDTTDLNRQRSEG